jgi:hypothetical protein
MPAIRPIRETNIELNEHQEIEISQPGSGIGEPDAVVVIPADRWKAVVAAVKAELDKAAG